MRANVVAHKLFVLTPHIHLTWIPRKPKACFRSHDGVPCVGSEGSGLSQEQQPRWCFGVQQESSPCTFGRSLAIDTWASGYGEPVVEEARDSKAISKRALNAGTDQ